MIQTVVIHHHSSIRMKGVKVSEPLVLGFMAALGISLLFNNKNETRDYHYSIGPIYNDLKVNGVSQTVQVITDLGKKSVTFISTTAIQDRETGQTAEVLFSSITRDLW